MLDYTRLTSKLCYTGEEKASINIILMMKELGPSDIWTLNPAKKDFFCLTHTWFILGLIISNCFFKSTRVGLKIAILGLWMYLIMHQSI